MTRQRIGRKLSRGIFLYTICLAVISPTLPARAALPHAPNSSLREVSVRLRTLKAADILLSGADLKIADHRLPTQSLWLKPVQDAWMIRARNAAPIKVASLDLNVSAHALTIDNEPVPGHTSLSARGSKIDVIAHLDLETYLLGVLPAEMPSTWPIEALKAQAIAARTFAVRKMQERGERSFQLDSSVSDQMYKYREPAAAVVQAVTETRGQILVDENGAPIEAFFHADCGGQTELARNVWRISAGSAATTADTTTINTVRDSGCRFNSKNGWSYQIETRELYAKLGDVMNLPRRGEFVSLSPREFSESGRVKTLALSYKNQDGEIEERLLNSQLYRAAIGFDRVKSTLFTISSHGETIVMTGRGSGHGVGLCQQGARLWALRGLKAPEILAHYYQTAHLK